MNTNLFAVLLTAFVLVSPPAVLAGEQYWNLPIKIDPSNSKVSFEVDTTWHTVHGVVKQLRGNLSLSEPSDFSSITGDVVIPVLSLDTDNGMRDDKMREVMDATHFTQIKFHLDKASKICSPEQLASAGRCEVQLDGVLEIRNVKRDVHLSGEMSRAKSGYTVNARTKFRWADFGVEDPSILVARVAEEVVVLVQVALTDGGQERS